MAALWHPFEARISFTWNKILPGYMQGRGGGLTSPLTMQFINLVYSSLIQVMNRKHVIWSAIWYVLTRERFWNDDMFTFNWYNLKCQQGEKGVLLFKCNIRLCHYSELLKSSYTCRQTHKKEKNVSKAVAHCTTLKRYMHVPGVNIG